jgi:hypothetical protein
MQEAGKCPPVEYVYDMELELGENETVNDTLEVDYEYSYDMNVSMPTFSLRIIRSVATYFKRTIA